MELAELKELLADLQPRRRPGEYVFCSTTRRHARALEGAPVALFREEEGVTEVLPQGRADAERALELLAAGGWE